MGLFKTASKLAKICLMATFLSCQGVPPAPDYHPHQIVIQDQKAIAYQIVDQAKLRFKATGEIKELKDLDGWMAFPPEDIAGSRSWIIQIQDYHQKKCKP